MLLDAIPASPNMKCEIEPDPIGPNYKVYITAWHQEATGLQTNRLILKLRDPQGQEQSVPVPVSVAAAEPRS